MDGNGVYGSSLQIKYNKWFELMVNKLINYKFVTLYLMCIVNFLAMHYGVINNCGTELSLPWTSYIDNLLGVIFDITLLYIFFHAVTCGRKIAIAITFIISLMWAICNIIYSRFFSSYITLSAISQIESLIDPIVLRSILYSCELQDVFPLVWVIIFFFIYLSLHQEYNHRYVAFSMIIFASILLVDLSSHAVFCALNPSFRYISFYKQKIMERHFLINEPSWVPMFSTFNRGSLRMLLLENYRFTSISKELSERQKNIIQNYINKSRNTVKNVEQKRPQNIIFIIVESYMAFTSDMTMNGQEITPNLNSLRHNNAVYYNGHMQPNIRLGESSDGQYIYMTGLLPLKSAITVSIATNKNLPGLPTILNKSGFLSQMIIPTSPSVWSQEKMCRQYGFNELYSRNDYKDANSDLNDEQVFMLAKEKLPPSSQKFFSVILTMSMHQPFIVPPYQGSLNFDQCKLSKDMKNYLNACHYTDKYIGEFLSYLKTSGYHKNTLIIIAADHHIHKTGLNFKTSKNLPFYIINAIFDKKSAYYGICQQIDVYTTILDILGLREKWCGLGHSLISTNYENSLINNIKFDISEWILNSDYFDKE